MQSHTFTNKLDDDLSKMETEEKFKNPYILKGPYDSIGWGITFFEDLF